jgi:hypothetical protein
VMISFRATVEGLLKDHAVAVFYVLTTRCWSTRPSYTTSMDSTGFGPFRAVNRSRLREILQADAHGPCACACWLGYAKG